MSALTDQGDALQDIRHTCELDGKTASFTTLYTKFWTDTNTLAIATGLSTAEAAWYNAQRLFYKNNNAGNKNNNAGNFTFVIGGVSYTLTAGATYAFTFGQANTLIDQVTAQAFTGMTKVALAEYDATGVNTVFGIG